MNRNVLIVIIVAVLLVASGGAYLLLTQDDGGRRRRTMLGWATWLGTCTNWHEWWPQMTMSLEERTSTNSTV